ncbi:MAG: hypothetical protein HZB76_03150 [Chlamydiae bacterium]|nr:hypothetical protein [Chlamydiota bacterium]
MSQDLSIILEIQDLDMKMLRLMKVKQERLKELEHIATLRKDLKFQISEKEQEIVELNKNIIIQESKIQDIKERLKKLEAKQSSIKKVEEFNALTQEMSSAEKERVATEHMTSDLIDKRNAEEEMLQKIKKSLLDSEESSKALEAEIQANVKMINKEGQELKVHRDAKAKLANQEVLNIYERLLRNKRDRVVVPMENRTCSGCHISLTAQHENSVRKGERLTFCEHCSRILYWLEAEEAAAETAPKKRRRKAPIS